MPLKTPVEYVESLRSMNVNAYIGAEKLDSPVDHPAIAPHVNTVAKIYELAQDPENKGLITTESHLTGREINRFTHIFLSTDDLLCKIKMLRLLGQTTGTCFQRCVGLDAMNASYAISYEVDEARGTDYHQRFKDYLTGIQDNDLIVAGAMTDPKGNRTKSPSQQDDPDQFVRVVERRPDGVVIRGAKLHNTGGINSHEFLVLPGTALKPEEADYAIACAVPADAEGVTLIFGRQSNDDRKLQGSSVDMGNPRFGVVGGEVIVIFDDVFVPNERIFLNGETEFVGQMVNYFATWHRANYGGCKGGNADVLIGATAKVASIHGVEKNAIVKDKVIEMIHLSETCYAGAIGASASGYVLPCGSYMCDPMMANTVKQNITRNIYAMGRLAHDVAGGYLATLPEEAAFNSPEIGEWVRKYHTCNDGDDVMERVRYGRYIENATSITTLVEAMHGAGSPQAQRIVMLGLGDLKSKIAMAEDVIEGDNDVLGITIRGRVVSEKTDKQD
jgi:4-hydroxybutyryl-CoA dehydratase/vinylacetyl-CoA-Delta-isomerase